MKERERKRIAKERAAAKMAARGKQKSQKQIFKRLQSKKSFSD